MKIFKKDFFFIISLKLKISYFLFNSEKKLKKEEKYLKF